MAKRCATTAGLFYEDGLASEKLVGFAPLLHLFPLQETAIPRYALTLACASAWAA